MQKLSFFTSRSDITIKQQHVYYEEFPDIKFYYLLTDSSFIPVRHNCAYIGTSSQVAEMLEDFHADFPVLFILTDCPDGFFEQYQQLKCNLLYIPADIGLIYRALNESFGIYSYWSEQFQIASLSPDTTLHMLLDLGSQMLHSPLFLLNTGYTLLDCSLEERAEITFPGFKELDQKGYLSPQARDALLACPYMELYPIRHGTSVYAWLMFYCDEENEYRRTWFLSLLTEPIKQQLLLADQLPADSSSVALMQFLRDLIEMQIVTSEEVENRAQLLKLPRDVFYHLLVVPIEDRRDDTRALHSLKQALRKELPSAQLCLYENHLILFFAVKEKHIPVTDLPSLQALLTCYNTCLGYGGCLRHLEQLRSLYLWSCSAVRLGQKLGEPGERIFCFDDYRIYYMIDLCRTGFQNIHFHDNLLYLCHPDIITLCRYDQEHQSDYLHILYEYLSLDCNFAKTARQLNYHRNTLMYKISKIESILGRPLAQAEYKQILLYSCKIARYIRDYLGREPSQYNAQSMANKWIPPR